MNSLDIALGETNETENWLYKIRDLGLATEQTIQNRLKQVTEVRKMLLALSNRIQEKSGRVREVPGDDSWEARQL